MQEFDVDAFITEVERLGLKLTATRLLDGTYRVNRWRMPDAISNAQQIEDLWAKHIGDDKARMITLGTHLARRSFEPSQQASPLRVEANAGHRTCGLKRREETQDPTRKFP
jgi:hypothetical protein